MKKRLNNVSLLRLFSMISILIFHILMVYFGESQKNFFPVYFGVQIFLFISGLLYSKSNITSAKEFYKKQFAKILIPVAIIVLIEFALCAFINPAVASPIGWFNALFGGQSNGIIALGHLWFIAAILVCYLLVPKLKNITLGGGGKMLLTISLLIELVIDLFSSTPVSLPAFILGYFFGERELLPKLCKNKPRTLLLSLFGFISFSGIYYIFRNIIPRSTSVLAMLSSYFERLSVVFISLSFAIFMLVLFEKLNNLPAQPKILVWSDKYSFAIYLCHHILMVNTASCLFLTPSYALNILITLILTLVLSVYVTRLGNFITKQYFNKKQ